MEGIAPSSATGPRAGPKREPREALPMDVSRLSIDVDGGHKVVNKTYRLIHKIGQGQFGKVMLAQRVASSEYVAIKTINRVDRTRLITKTYLSHTTKIKREIQIMKECRHPNVVQLYQVIDDLKYDKILLVLEYCQLGEIDWKRYNHYHEKYFKGDNGLVLNKVLRDVVNGLEYLHDKCIIHRDLKPSNLLISADKTIKISDFGVSLILENNQNDDRELGKSMGTPAFFAPELCQFVNNRYLMIADVDRQKSKIDKRIDVWSLGVVLYCMLFHNLPFSADNEFALFKKIVNEKLRFPQISMASRTTADDVTELKLLKDLIGKLLTKEPNERITLKDIKQHAFTTFDLKNTTDISAFMDFNKPFTERKEAGITSRIRKFFTRTEPQKEFDPVKLEPLDDLLDSYLDDSSSMGTIEDENVDTSNILGDLTTASDEEPPRPKFQRPLREMPSNDNFSLDFLLKPREEERSPEQENKHNTMHRRTGSDRSVVSTRSKSSIKELPRDSSWLSRVKVPPPLKLKDTSYGSKPSTPQRSHFSPIVTPGLANDDVVTIGAGSPLSLKLIFSPSRRFFSRKKKTEEVKPTISSLSSPEKKATKKKFTDLMEPPPIFSAAGTSAFEKPKGKDPFSDPLRKSLTLSRSSLRKNSFASMRLAGGLLRMTSSTSLLNLNAYLTDDAFSLSSQPESPNDFVFSGYRGEPDADETFVIEEPGSLPYEPRQPQGAATNSGDEVIANRNGGPAHEVATSMFTTPTRKYSAMSDFLDRL